MAKGNSELLCEMLAGRGELLKQLKGLREETAWTRPEPNEWSVVEILQHTSDIDLVSVRRFRDYEEGKQELTVYVPGEWEAERAAAEKESLSGVLRRLYASRVELLEAVARLDEATLERTAIHPRRGPRTARQVALKAGDHDVDHAQQIAKTRAVVEK